MVTFTIFILTLFTIIILYYITFTFIYTERCSIFFTYGYHLSLMATNLELNQTKVILGTTEGDVKQCFYNHKKSFQ